MLKTAVCLLALILFAGCSSSQSKVKAAKAPQTIAPEKKYSNASKDLKRCQEAALEKNLPESDDAGVIRDAVLTGCKKQFSDYWMATLLKYRIQEDLKQFEQAYLETLDREIAQKLAQKKLGSSSASSKP